jgi:hypothetical protein
LPREASLYLSVGWLRIGGLFVGLVSHEGHLFSMNF